ncbi:MAG: type VI secretion system-associated protein TagF, partial [Lysobacterales bacterium]
MMVCRERFPEGWMTFYLNCPAWSFVLSAGLCGEQAVAGVTIPSVDRVGRYFNFTMASILPAEISPAVFAGTNGDWLANLENLALSVLEEEMDQDGIEDAINQSSAELTWNPVAHTTYSNTPEHEKVMCDGSAGVRELLPELLHGRITSENPQYGLWWHHGSSQVNAQLVSCVNMPSADIYLGLMVNEDTISSDEGPSQPPEVDYLDELLAD